MYISNYIYTVKCDHLFIESSIEYAALLYSIDIIGRAIFIWLIFHHSTQHIAVKKHAE